MSKNIKYLNNFIADKVEKVKEKEIKILTDFLEPPEVLYSQALLKQERDDLLYFFYGAHEEAERKRLCLAPFGRKIEAADFDILILEAKAKKLMREISHRDLLGALMGSGIKREKTGDIFVDKDTCILVLDRKIAIYLADNFPLIKGNSFDCKLLEVADYNFPKQSLEEMTLSISSWRLDNFLAKAWSCSRGQAQSYIQAGRVKVNHLESFKADQILKEDDLVSLRGKGRFVIAQAAGQSKKGNYRVLINKFL